MGGEEEIVRIARRLDKMVAKKSAGWIWLESIWPLEERKGVKLPEWEVTPPGDGWCNGFAERTEKYAYDFGFTAGFKKRRDQKKAAKAKGSPRRDSVVHPHWDVGERPEEAEHRRRSDITCQIPHQILEETPRCF